MLRLGNLVSPTAHAAPDYVAAHCAAAVSVPWCALLAVPSVRLIGLYVVRWFCLTFVCRAGPVLPALLVTLLFNTATVLRPTVSFLASDLIREAREAEDAAGPQL